ncbi:MAG: TAT-variant-translocated molybdopterin oxidoreductase [Candidatus Latescibacteria bacterium]|nr:TAT-variant-translocated molybdopterin oxidoreductase [Candidatus Latescibacterota bacterium]
MIEEEFSRKSLGLGDKSLRLEQSTGPEYWRSLDELAGTPAFREMVEREFPAQASELFDPVNRRNFLKLMGASLAFGGLSACTVQPPEKIVPYVRAPENMIPGKPLFYATVSTVGGVATGILVESHMGRPTKIEGNPKHPASLGATDAVTQAAILNLYDPDRAQSVTNAGRPSTWDTLVQQLTQALDAQRGKGGAGLHLLTETVTSPLLGDQIDTLLTEFPQAVWHQYEPGNRDQAHRGAELAFGEPLNTYCDLSQAQVILSLDADFLNSGPAGVRYAKQLAAGRRVRDGQPEMNRLYVAESTPTATGSLADHRFPLRPSQIEALAFALARQLGVEVQAEGAAPEFEASWLEALVADLRRAGSRSAVLVGDHQPPAVHALAHALNVALGNVGTTVFHTSPLAVKYGDQHQSLTELAAAMAAGQVEVLLILGGNPVYTAPADLNFGQGLRQVPLSVHLGLYDDETSQLCHWHVGESHFLEAWGDARSFDGTASIVQPLIEPLYNTKSANEVLAALIGQGGRSIYDVLREYWSLQATDPDFETYWKVSLHDGMLAGTGFQPLQVSPLKPLAIPAAARAPEGQGLELALRLDPNLGDGRYANNGWLQEIPRPLTRLMWDNAALVSPATASRLGLENQQLVDIEVQGRRQQVPVWILPGQAEETLTLHLGYGRTQAGRVGNGVGFNVYPLRTSAALWQASGIKVNKTFSTYPLACVQEHNSMEGRHLVRSASLEEYTQHPHFAAEEAEDPAKDLTLYPRTEHDAVVPNAWGMVIDLSACTGCNACMVACQAENNIPVVGKEQVLNGREMHWIRIDRYFKDDVHNPEIYHQPVPCMHCENAPCEVVCPVGATVHDEEGLNEMVYNRCVGTRYCNNNCPYKVRRFNFFQYVDRDIPSLELQRNPDVTVRSRGVMEKCTYCVQRINAARIESKKDDRPIADGEILTACQQVCPTDAIVFGNLKDAQSQVAKLKANPLNYGILTDLNTSPRTTYLARVKNLNPEISEG